MSKRLFFITSLPALESYEVFIDIACCFGVESSGSGRIRIWGAKSVKVQTWEECERHAKEGLLLFLYLLR